MVLGFIILSAFRYFALGRKTNPVECDMHDTDMNVHEPLLDTRMVHDHISHASNEPFVVDDPGSLPHPATDIAIAFVVTRFSET